MRVSLEEVPQSAKPTLANLLELDIHDLAELEERQIGEDGRYGYRYLDDYWLDAGRHAFFIRDDGRLSGFALIRRGSLISADPDTMDMCEFFVLKGCRRKGVGQAAALKVLDRYRGDWEVRVHAANAVGQRFWRTILGRLALDSLEERRLNDERWHGSVWALNYPA